MIQIYPQGDCILIRLGYSKSNSAKDIKKDPSHIKLKKQTRVIPLYFMKYAATVCVYLSVSVQYFKFSSNTNFIQTEENSFVTASAKEDTITPEIPLEALAEKEELLAYKHDGFWQSMDTLRDKVVLDSYWSENQPPWKVW